MHPNRLGSIQFVTNEAGEVVYRTFYTPYGERVDAKTTGDRTTRYGFTGQEEDNTGLMNYGARLYDPQIGRFIQADTEIPDPLSVHSYNRYAYCANNPVFYTDPTGHENESPDNVNDNSGMKAEDNTKNDTGGYDTHCKEGDKESIEHNDKDGNVVSTEVTTSSFDKAKTVVENIGKYILIAIFGPIIVLGYILGLIYARDPNAKDSNQNIVDQKEHHQETYVHQKDASYSNLPKNQTTDTQRHDIIDALVASAGKIGEHDMDRSKSSVENLQDALASGCKAGGKSLGKSPGKDMGLAALSNSPAVAIPGGGLGIGIGESIGFSMFGKMTISIPSFSFGGFTAGPAKGSYSSKDGFSFSITAGHSF